MDDKELEGIVQEITGRDDYKITKPWFKKVYRLEENEGLLSKISKLGKGLATALLIYTISCGSPEEKIPLTRPNYIKPKGTVKVLIVEFKPKNYQTNNMIYGCSKWNPTDVIESLNNENPTDCLPSLYTIKDWYKNESNEYGKDLNLEIDIIGPYDTERIDYSYENRYGILNHFQNKLSENNISNSDYDIITYLYLNDFDTNTEEEFQKDFTSFSNIYSNEIFVNTIYSYRNDIAIQVFAHEIGHQFGARDLYYQNYTAPIIIYGFNDSLCEIPNGIPEPDKDPLFPQEKGCIMCNRIMPNETTATHYIENGINKMLTCDYTAEEFGWINFHLDLNTIVEKIPKPRFMLMNGEN